MSLSYFQLDEVKKQLDSIPIKYPFMESFLKNKDLQNELVRRGNERIEKSLEDIITVCGDIFFPLLGSRHEKFIDFVFPKKEIHKLCMDTVPSYIHFHGGYLGWLSQTDFDANQTFFEDGANMSCAVGIDGIHCKTLYNYIRIPWNENYYEKLKRAIGADVFSNVKSLNCIKQKKQFNKISWVCKIGFKFDKGSHLNVFDEVDYEHSASTQSDYPYNMLENKEKKDPVIKTVIPFSHSYTEIYNDNEDVKCVAMDQRKDTKPKRILSCFKISNIKGY